jgi:hypothetical protein
MNKTLGLVLELSSLLFSFKLFSIVSKNMDRAFLPCLTTRVCWHVLKFGTHNDDRYRTVYACMSQCKVLRITCPKGVQMMSHWLSYPETNTLYPIMQLRSLN